MNCLGHAHISAEIRPQLYIGLLKKRGEFAISPRLAGGLAIAVELLRILRGLHKFLSTTLTERERVVLFFMSDTTQ